VDGTPFRGPLLVLLSKSSRSPPFLSSSADSFIWLQRIPQVISSIPAPLSPPFWFFFFFFFFWGIFFLKGFYWTALFRSFLRLVSSLPFLISFAVLSMFAFPDRCCLPDLHLLLFFLPRDCFVLHDIDLLRFVFCLLSLFQAHALCQRAVCVRSFASTSPYRCFSVHTSLFSGLGD